MQKLHNSKTPKVYKNKKLNNANFGTYNLNDYQVFLQVVSKLGKLDETGTYKQPQELDREYTLTAKEFSLAFGVDLNTSYGVLKRASNRLARTAITLEKPELFEVWEIPVCEISKYNTKDGSITVTFSTHIMPYLAQVREKFVLYNLKEIANFGSLYTTRLYELIQEFKDTGWLIKSVPQLRETFAVGKKFKLYADFKKNTFAHAVKEINSQYEINLSFEEIKDGRKVVAIRFEFKPSYKSQGYNPATKQMVNTTVKPRRKRNDDDNSGAPPITHSEQLELPIFAQVKPTSTTKKVIKKVAKAVLTKEVAQALENNTSILDAAKQARATRANLVVDEFEKIAKAAKILIDTLGLAPEQALELAKKQFS